MRIAPTPTVSGSTNPLSDRSKTGFIFRFKLSFSKEFKYQIIIYSYYVGHL
jgi:hypothetical protein